VHQAFSLQINPAQPITYSPGTVLSQSQSGSGPGMLVALDQGINAADNNNGVAVAVIGIPGSPSGPVIASGSAFGTIFIQDTAGNWNAAAQLTAPTTGVYTSVAISGDGNTIVVGSCATTVSPCASNSSGFAYVYTTANNNWTGTLSSPATLSVSNRGLGFGTRVPAVSVDFNGDTIAMGAAPFSTQGTGQGVVAVFLRPAGGWASKNDDVQLTANVVEVGTSVSIDDSGDTIVAGAAVGTQSASEGAFVFIKPSGTQGWAVTTNNGTITTPTATLAQSNGLAGDRFGASVAISGDGHTVAIGTPNYPDCTPFPCNTGGPGAVYVFANPSSPSAWGTMQQPVTENALLTASNGKLGDRLGWSTAVSKDGGTIVSGAQAAPNGSCCTFGPGAIYVFQASGAWSGSVLETQSFTATSTQTVSPQTNFGASTAITGDSTSIGVGGVATVNGTRNQQVVYLFQ
jgi:WD40 repeat protein